MFVGLAPRGRPSRAHGAPRRLLVAAGVCAALSLGCGVLDPAADVGLAPAEDVPITFAAPEMVTVRSGDTLAILAKRHRVSVDDIKGWNGLTTDTIEVDQVLLVWTAPPPMPKAAKPSLRQQLEQALTGSADGGEVASAPEGAPDGVPPPIVVEGVEAAEIVVPRGTVKIETPGLVDLQRVEVGSDVDLADVAAGLERHDSVVGNAGLGDRSLGTGDQADQLEMKQRQQTNAGPQIPNTPVYAPRLTKPAPKACLKGPSAIVREDGTTQTQGLSVGQINASMAQISRYTVRCFPAGTKGSYAMIVEINVGCDGRVNNVYLIDGGVVPANVTGCLQQTLSYAGFPAHASPGGISFQYPMKFTF